MVDYYDRDLDPIDSLTGQQSVWEGKRVLKTQVEKYTVSTVWLGLDHRHGGGHPIVFETMIFVDGNDVDARRHRSEEDAARWHLKALDAIRNGAEPSYEKDWLKEDEVREPSELSPEYVPTSDDPEQVLRTKVASIRKHIDQI